MLYAYLVFVSMLQQSRNGIGGGEEWRAPKPPHAPRTRHTGNATRREWLWTDWIFDSFDQNDVLTYAVSFDD